MADVILELVRAGESDKVIAARLHYSSRQVRRMVERLRVRYGARNRTHLAALATEARKPRSARKRRDARSESMGLVP